MRLGSNVMMAMMTRMKMVMVLMMVFMISWLCC